MSTSMVKRPPLTFKEERRRDFDAQRNPETRVSGDGRRRDGRVKGYER